MSHALTEVAGSGTDEMRVPEQLPYFWKRRPSSDTVTLFVFGVVKSSRQIPVR